MKCVKCGFVQSDRFQLPTPTGWLCQDCAHKRINLLESALRHFCTRVESGEIKSAKTYRKFKELLGEPVK